MEVKSNLVGNGAMRVTIPKRLRDELEWTPGEVLNVVREGETIVLSRCQA